MNLISLVLITSPTFQWTINLVLFYVMHLSWSSFVWFNLCVIYTNIQKLIVRVIWMKYIHADSMKNNSQFLTKLYIFVFQLITNGIGIFLSILSLISFLDYCRACSEFPLVVLFSTLSGTSLRFKSGVHASERIIFWYM